ncbi:MAG TPA: hypothetical protein PKA00_06590 [Saprospiraceae bacterium]|nr:hypothetical protein [Saprospiraceae bacterium]HMQ82554.1 hypothetical protein [Saprospiraceae bacterium]
MEKIIPSDSDLRKLVQTNDLEPADSKVQLRKKHLWIAADVATNAFNEEQQVYAVYYPKMGMLLLAPMSDSLFKQAHECLMLMLKDRNLQGDKSLSLQEIIIDNDLDDTDRPLAYTAVPGLRMLQVKFAP